MPRMGRGTTCPRQNREQDKVVSWNSAAMRETPLALFLTREIVAYNPAMIAQVVSELMTLVQYPNEL